MPKLIPKPTDKLKRLVLANLDYECSLRGISKEEMRLITRCSEPTYNKKRKDPGEFTLNELMRFADKLKIPVADLFKEKEAVAV